MKCQEGNRHTPWERTALCKQETGVMKDCYCWGNTLYYAIVNDHYEDFAMCCHDKAGIFSFSDVLQWTKCSIHQLGFVVDRYRRSSGVGGLYLQDYTGSIANKLGVVFGSTLESQKPTDW